MLNFPCRTEKDYILHGAECLEGTGNAVRDIVKLTVISAEQNKECIANILTLFEYYFVINIALVFIFLFCLMSSVMVKLHSYSFSVRTISHRADKC